MGEVGRIDVRHDDGIAFLTIENPRKRNAFTEAMTASLSNALESLEGDGDIRCVVVRGAGDDAFSSGHDLSEMLDTMETAADSVANRAFTMPVSMRTPVVAAITGSVYAAGLILAMSCDLRVADPSARFGAPGARIGLLPIGGQLSVLPRLVPPGIALEMLLTGDPIDAHRAHECCLVNALVERGEVDRRATEIARRIAANAPAVVGTAKRAVHRGLAEGAAVAAAYEDEVAGFLLTEPDGREGVAAFLEKRWPRFGASRR